jgi:hypothetical protein
MAQADVGGPPAHKISRAALDNPQPPAGGQDRRVPPAHPAAARRPPLGPTAVDPRAHTIALHRGLQRRGISRLPEPDGETPARRTARSDPTGVFHGERAVVRHRSEENGTRRGARPGRATFTSSGPWTGPRRSLSPGFTPKPPGPLACPFLDEPLEAVPCRIHTPLPDRALEAAIGPSPMARASSSPSSPGTGAPLSREGRFEMICEANGIEHRLTKTNHPWTNGQGCHDEAVSPRRSRPGSTAPRDGPRHLQPRAPAQDSQGPLTRPVPPYGVAGQARTLPRRAVPLDGGTDHLAPCESEAGNSHEMTKLAGG